MNMSHHAAIRSQQRGVPPLVVDLLLQFGRSEYDGRGGEVFYFDHRARKRVQAYTGGHLGKLSGEMDAYAVVANGKVVTVGTRYKRVNHV